MSAVKKFENLGVTIQEVSIPSHLEGPSLWTIQQRIAGAMNIIGQAHGRRGLYLVERFPGLYGKTVNLGRKVRDDYEKAFQDFDVLVMPTTPFVAPSTAIQKEHPESALSPV